MSSKSKNRDSFDIPKHPMLWRGKDLLPQLSSSSANCAALPSGYQELDHHLHRGGWPQQGLMELLLPQAGIGELRLLLPALQQLTQNTYVAWINPPFIPYATALKAGGVNTDNLLVVRTRTHEETLWSMERCCLSNGCAGVMAWPEEHKLNIKETRRIQLAARSGKTLAMLFRPINAIERSSLAELRLALRPTTCIDHLSLDIVKRKGGWPVQGIELSLTQASQTPYDMMHHLHQQLAVWEKEQQLPMPAERTDEAAPKATLEKALEDPETNAQNVRHTNGHGDTVGTLLH
jgi:cell division inhibitor SulA